MSTIKSSNEHLTLNADGSGKDIKFQSNGSEVAQITDGGVVSSTGGSTNADNVKVKFGTGNDLEIYHSGVDSFIDDVGTGRLMIRSDNHIRLGKYTGEEMIDAIADGAVSLYHNNVKKFETSASGIEVTGVSNASAPVVGINSNSYSSGTVYIVRYRVNDSTKGSVTSNGSSVAFNTSSDYRLKENVDYTWDATTRLKQLKPARFNFIADNTNTLVDGFIAHEVSSIVPEAVTGEKDAAEMQGIDQSKLVPLLVKTIQELEARITALES